MEGSVEAKPPFFFFRHKIPCEFRSKQWRTVFSRRCNRSELLSSASEATGKLTEGAVSLHELSWKDFLNDEEITFS